MRKTIDGLCYIPFFQHEMSLFPYKRACKRMSLIIALETALTMIMAILLIRSNKSH